MEDGSRKAAKKRGKAKGKAIKPKEKKSYEEIPLDVPSPDVPVVAALTDVESIYTKKLRNLEKRKQKLMRYGKDKAKGIPLSEEQVEAAAMLGCVEEQLEHVSDMLKMVCKCKTNAVTAAKIVKANEAKKVRRETISNFRLIMHYQQVLVAFQTSLRPTFASGNDGTMKLSPKELELMDGLCAILAPSLKTSESLLEFTEAARASAGHLFEILNASSNLVFADYSGSDVKRLLDRVAECIDSMDRPQSSPNIATEESTGQETELEVTKSGDGESESGDGEEDESVTSNQSDVPSPDCPSL